MDEMDQTRVTYFIIKGISDIPEFQAPIFLLVLLIYLTTLGGNLTIVLLVCLDSHLHTPMYFFLGNLSLLDMSSATVTLHSTLVAFVTGDNTVSFLEYSCYVSNIINHFFCDLVPLMKLSCSDTSVLEMLILTEGMLINLLTPSSLTFISYVFIIGTILKIRSSTGRSKAFYTCSSHLTVVLLLYMTLFCQYIRPISTDSLESNKLFSLFNTALVPMLNPLIYSLKNKDVKSALRRQLNLLKIIF
ncbi:olfactory receptor 8K1-like [Discoglossus pictus]